MLDSDHVVTVLSTGDKATLALAKCLLEGSGIDYCVSGEMIQDLFGWGRLGGFNRVTGPVRIMVRPEEEEAVRQLLMPLSEVRPARVPLVLRLIALAGVLFFLYNLPSALIGSR